MVQYDPSVIQSQAEKLYRKAARLQYSRMASWALVGFLAAYLTVVVLDDVFLGTVSPPVGGVVAAGLMGWAGFRSAIEAASRLRLEPSAPSARSRSRRNTSAREPSHVSPKEFE